LQAEIRARDGSLIRNQKAITQILRDPMVCMAIEIYLQCNNFRVTIAEGGETGLRAVRIDLFTANADRASVLRRAASLQSAQTRLRTICFNSRGMCKSSCTAEAFFAARNPRGH
jgi:hypothetical protein